MIEEKKAPALAGAFFVTAVAGLAEAEPAT
jgi:hypothetical protein